MALLTHLFSSAHARAAFWGSPAANKLMSLSLLFPPVNDVIPHRSPGRILRRHMHTATATATPRRANHVTGSQHLPLDADAERATRRQAAHLLSL